MLLLLRLLLLMLTCFIKSRHSCLIRPPSLHLDFQRRLRFTRFRLRALPARKLLGQLSCYIAPQPLYLSIWHFLLFRGFSADRRPSISSWH